IEDNSDIEKDEIETTQDFGSNETIKVLSEEITDSAEIQTAIDSIKKQKNIQTTPTSTLDDGYESSNSTPQVSGKGKPKHQNSSSNLILTCTLRKKDLHVQLEEDEHESFVLSTSSSQAGEADPDSFNTDRNHEDDNRETWGSNSDFLLSIIGFAVDL
ncbi:unnamed protein product, partial [Callosobruchus maculatus]